MTYGSAPYASKGFGQSASFGVDNQARRMSAFNFSDPFDYILPIADSSVSALDRQHLWGMYIGIAAGAPVAEEEVDKFVRKIGAHGILLGGNPLATRSL